MARDCESVKAAADTFVQWANRKTLERDAESDLELQDTEEDNYAWRDGST